MRRRCERRGANPLVGNLLLVAVALVIAVVLTTLAFSFLDGLGTPTADAKFEYEKTPAGLEMTPVALGTDVSVKLNGNTIATIDADSSGESVLVPTAPGDRITVVSRDEDKSVLVDRTVDDRSEIGDFIAYYTFSEGSGTTLVDRSGNGNDGQINGGSVTWLGSGGIRFDGSDDYLEIKDISSPVDVDGFTIAVAYRQRGNDGSINQLVEHQYQSGGNEWFLETVDRGTGVYDVDYAVEYPSETISSGDTYDLGERHVAVGTYDGDSDTYKLYVDGKLKASDSFARSVNMGDMTIARDFESNIQYLDGDVYEVRLYYTAFDSEEVAAITEAMS